MIRTIVVDDEPLALRQMKSYLSRVEELELVGAFSNSEGADVAVEEQGVDLIFCDINMPNESGVEFVRRILNRCEVQGVDMPMVIFTTAHSEYAVEGFRLDAVDYLLKPISFGDFAASASRACSLYSLRSGAVAANNVDDIEVEQGDVEESEHYITIKSEYRQVPIRVGDIVFMESEGEYIRLHLDSGRSVTTFYRLKNMEAELPAAQFVRIHRSYIVNLDYIRSYERGRIYISDESYLPIGQNYRESFMQTMESRK